MHDDVVVIVLKRNRNVYSNQKHQRRDNEVAEKNHTFFLEFSIVSSTKRKSSQLKWLKYSVLYFFNLLYFLQGFMVCSSFF